MWMGQGADTLSVGCVLVRVLFQTVKHLFLAAKQWQFVSELWREVGPRQRGKGLTQSRSAQRGCRGTDACLSLCLRCRFMERLSPLWRVFFVRGRVHENPQEFFGKRSFALLIVVYRSPFGIVRESVPLARTLAACPAPGGAFLCGPPRSAQPMMRRRVGVAGLLVTLRGTSNRVGMAQTAGKPTHRCANRALCNRLCYCHCGVCLRGASPPLEDSLSPATWRGFFVRATPSPACNR